MAEQFLTQEEVDALLEGDEPADDGAAEPAGGIRPYNLASQERIVRGRMPTLEIVNERFARNLRIGLFNFMRKNPEISVGPVRVLKYSAFLRDIAVPTNINIVTVRPLHGSGVFIMDPNLVYSVVDSLFGGHGRHTRIEGRDFTATEQRIIQRMLEVVFADYKAAWAGIYPLELEYQRAEVHTQFANVAHPSEIVVATSFRVELGEAGGDMHLAIPYSTFEPIRDILFTSLQGNTAEPNKRWVGMLTRQVQAAEVELVGALAHIDATVGQLLELRPGDFIEFDLPRTVHATIDGVPLFEATYGVAHGHYALKVGRFLTQDHVHGDDHAH
ncbi:MAG TPA: flagellar motor switch protein FliM [Usitatibacteraceae bacterium]|nr:flagellar motor switch protein FliM [Usitatibacteraceae bacterium]